MNANTIDQREIRYVPGANILLGFLSAANMNSTADQAIAIGAAKYIVRRAVVYGASLSLTLAVGGIYTGAGKTGNAIVAATQVYSGLTGATKFLDLTLASIAPTDYLTASSLFLALTTAQGAAATANVAVFGDSLL